MQEPLIIFETAKLAKEKGFNIPVLNYINSRGIFDTVEPTTYYYMTHGHNDGINNRGGTIKLDYNFTKIDFSDLDTYGRHWLDNGEEELYSCPTQSLLKKWLRDIHNIHIIEGRSSNEEVSYAFNIIVKNGIRLVTECFHDYEVGLENMLQKALKLIK